MVRAIGLPAALIGELAGLNVHVMDRVTSAAKADLVRSLDAVYHLTPCLQRAFEPDIIIECTGIGQVIPESILRIGAGGPMFLTGVGRGGAAAGPCSGIMSSQAARTRTEDAATKPAKCLHAQTSSGREASFREQRRHRFFGWRWNGPRTTSKL